MGSSDTIDGQQRRAGLAAGDQIAGIDAPVGDAPGNGRAHLGPFEIELGLLERGLGRRRPAPAASRCVDLPRIELALGQGLVAHQRRRPLHVGRGDLKLGLRPLEIGFGLIDRELVGPLDR